HTPAVLPLLSTPVIRTQFLVRLKTADIGSAGVSFKVATGLALPSVVQICASRVAELLMVKNNCPSKLKAAIFATMFERDHSVAPVATSSREVFLSAATSARVPLGLNFAY